MTIKKIILTDKIKRLQKDLNTYAFLVSPELNKHQIKEQLLSLFPSIKIKRINTCRLRPVSQKVRYTRKLPGKHYTSLKKKAFVELAKGSEGLFDFENKS